ncbi:hypothetical protein LTR78_002023 [Recurvomyces mirabilis]|uniref:ISWI chromatin-remodeling complex ATPase ISW2 n=1 Tax=Recurvomyces mirabilis TaxID=574656 RepID=A0AAE1C4S2_9PEZI|nr:hypothetical protein LTR78_002023 [Recurvomyces mirabilis]KAK5160481.1 hypothetical protein LTS14_001493 [Recurvomyces mirabilis]
MDLDPLALDHATPPKRRKLLAVAPSPPRLSDLLKAFGAQKAPDSARRMQRLSTGRDARPRAAVNYAESNGDSTPDSSPRSISSFEDPLSSRTSLLPNSHDDSEESDDELQSADVVQVAPQRTGTRELPARSTRSLISYGTPKKKISKKQAAAAKKRRSTSLLKLDTVASAQTQPQTARGRIRQDILDHTRPKREAFLLAKQDLFLPVLPATNYITKLRQSRPEDSGVEVINGRTIEQPMGVLATMKPYQLEGLSFLLKMHDNGMSCILGDEMGLGKTLQTLALFQYLVENEARDAEPRPHLVVCPLSVLSSWMTEARRWVPDLKAIRFHGPVGEREKLKKQLLLQSNGSSNLIKSDTIPMPDIIVTTYETFKSEANWFKRAFAWKYVVLDEGHKIKNEGSQMATALFSLQAEYRLLLTGTPLQNNLKEMWALLHWLLPEVFPTDTSVMFKDAFDIGNGKVSTTFLDSARDLLELLMLRRMKDSPEIELGLPPKEEVLLYVPLTPVQRFWYTRLLTKSDTALLDDLFKDVTKKEAVPLEIDQDQDQDISVMTAKTENDDPWSESLQLAQQQLGTEQSEKTSDWKKLMNIVLQLQRICCHPYLLKSCLPEPYYLGEHIIAASGKFIVLQKLLEELVVQRRKKILIFSGWTKALDVCEDLMAFMGANTHDAKFRYLRLDGSTGRAKRNLGIRMFNDKKSDFRVMLISRKAGGLGLNLAAATSVIFLDEDWNPQITLQAEARAHRIGQTEPVTIYKIITQGTVEEQMMGRIRKKLYLSAKITESMRNIHSTAVVSKKRKRGAENEDEPALGAGQLKSLLRLGARTLARPEVDLSAMLSWSFEKMVEECKDKVDDVVAEVDEAGEQAWLQSMERVETAVFEGKNFQREVDKKAKEQEELSRADRRVGKNTTVMIDGFAINKESLNCADWEAVPTMAGKDPRLAEPRREKKVMHENQAHCQHCWDGGSLLLCSGCPRSYHYTCLDKEFKAKSKSKMGTFFCPQHQCVDCGSKTAEAGGMIFRCRWCEHGYCEDCVEWDTARLVGGTLQEYEMIGFGEVDQAWYIECADCIKHFEAHGKDREMMTKERSKIEKAYEKFAQA